jgi:hypothetical protein
MSKEIETLKETMQKAQDAIEKGNWPAVTKHLDDAKVWVHAITSRLPRRVGINVGS